MRVALWLPIYWSGATNCLSGGLLTSFVVSTPKKPARTGFSFISEVSLIGRNKRGTKITFLESRPCIALDPHYIYSRLMITSDDLNCGCNCEYENNYFFMVRN